MLEVYDFLENYYSFSTYNLLFDEKIHIFL